MAESILITGNNISLAGELGDKFVPMSIKGGSGQLQSQSYTLPCFPKTLTIEMLVTTKGDANIHLGIPTDGKLSSFTNSLFGKGLDTIHVSCTDNILTIEYTAIFEMDTFNMTDVIVSYEGFEEVLCTVKNTTMSFMGDAIRGATGKTEKLTPSEMVEAIKSLPTTTYGYRPTKWENGYPVEGVWYGENVADFAFASYSSTTLAGATINDYGKPFCLKKVTFADEIKSIGKSAFAGCTKLENWDLPDSVETIGDYAFFNSSLVLTDFRFPSSVQTIGTKIFGALPWIYTIYFKGTPTSIDANAFVDLALLMDIYVPWAENEVANAPWGATSATIHYNSTESKG